MSDQHMTEMSQFALDVAIPTGALIARMRTNASKGEDTVVTPDEVERLVEFLIVLNSK